MTYSPEAIRKAYDEKWEKLKALELKVCTVSELLGMGHHLFCVAKKM